MFKVLNNGIKLAAVTSSLGLMRIEVNLQLTCIGHCIQLESLRLMSR